MEFPLNRNTTATGEENSAWNRLWVKGILFGAILILAAVLRLGCSNRTLWYDEAVSYWEASQSPLIQTEKSFSPLPSLIIRPLVGHWDEPWMLRLPFIFLGVTSVLIFSLAAAKLFGGGADLKIAMLLAISPFHVFYSTEIRMYAISLFGCALNFLFFLRILNHGGKKNWLFYSIGGAIAVFAHPFTALQLIAQGIYLLTGKKHRPLFVTWFWNQIAIFLLYLPLLIYGLKYHGAAGWVTSRPLIALAGTFYSLLMGMTFLRDPLWLFLTVLSASLFGFLFVKGILADKDNRYLITGLFLFPLAIAILISCFMSFYSDQSTRFLTFIQPFLVLLLIGGIEAIRGIKIRNCFFIGVIAVFLMALFPAYALWEQVGFGDFKKAAEIIRLEARQDDRILSKGLSGQPIAYYLRDGLINQMIIKNKQDTFLPYPESSRIWIIRLLNRSMLDEIRSPVKPEDVGPPPIPAGYRMIKHHVIPGRKPIMLTLFERAQS